MAITIKDIAEKTKFSITTVSLVLNHKAPHIPQRTQDLIFQAAEELNYLPNQLAVALSTKKTKTISLLIPDICNYFFSTLARGIENQTRKRGWTVILCNSGDNAQRDLEYIKVFSSKGVDGLIYCMSTDTTPEQFAQMDKTIRKYKIPYIVIDRFHELPNILFAKLDHFQGGYLATKHLIDLGHTKIACITGPSHLKDSKQRLAGYQLALDEANLSFDPLLIYEGNYYLDSGLAGAKHLLSQQFSAIFAFNDLMACGAWQALNTLNIKVPQDISLVGYDDTFLTELMGMSLTTVHQPIEKLGAASAEYLINLLESSDTTKQDLPCFPPKLIIRQSTAPYREREASMQA